MRNELIESTLKMVLPSLFSFARAFISSEQESKNLTFDALYIGKKTPRIIDLFRELQNTKVEAQKLEIPIRIKIEYFKILYQMIDVKLSKEYKDDGNLKSKNCFNNLSLSDQTILYLKYRENFDYRDLTQIFNNSHQDVVTKLVMAKNNLSFEVNL